MKYSIVDNGGKEPGRDPFSLQNLSREDDVTVSSIASRDFSENSLVGWVPVYVLVKVAISP
jgi:hypothetical protein